MILLLISVIVILPAFGLHALIKDRSVRMTAVEPEGHVQSRKGVNSVLIHKSIRQELFSLCKFIQGILSLFLGDHKRQHQIWLIHAFKGGLDDGEITAIRAFRCRRLLIRHHLRAAGGTTISCDLSVRPGNYGGRGVGRLPVHLGTGCHLLLCRLLGPDLLHGKRRVAILTGHLLFFAVVDQPCATTRTLKLI